MHPRVLGFRVRHLGVHASPSGQAEEVQRQAALGKARHRCKDVVTAAMLIEAAVAYRTHALLL